MCVWNNNNNKVLGTGLVWKEEDELGETDWKTDLGGQKKER